MENLKQYSDLYADLSQSAYTKRRIRLIFSNLLLMLMILGGCKMEEKYKTQEEQIAFLKKHESQMTEYVKSYNSQIETVEYDWSTTDSGVVGNGLPQGGGIAIDVRGFVNNNPRVGFVIAVDSKLTSVTSFEPEQDIYFISENLFRLDEKA